MKETSPTHDPPPKAAAMHLMLVPTRRCTASCRYCFFSSMPTDRPATLMDDALVEAILELIASSHGEAGSSDRLGRVSTVSFQGGEPLLAGADWFERIAKTIRDDPVTSEVELGIQSNLHPLDEAMIALIERYRIGIGTSLDGPKAITDANRGEGYFDATWAGVRRLQVAGLTPGVICTITAQSAPRWREILDFFDSEGLSFALHPAVSTGPVGDALALSPQRFLEVASLMMGHAPPGRVGLRQTLADQLRAGHGQLCTFTDCRGHFLAIAPEGTIYPCNRLLDRADARLGSVDSIGSFAELADAAFYGFMKLRMASLANSCGGCDYFDLCAGGCLYQAMMHAERGGAPPQDAGVVGKDPFCEAYIGLYDQVLDGVVNEVLAEESAR